MTAPRLPLLAACGLLLLSLAYARPAEGEERDPQPWAEQLDTQDGVAAGASISYSTEVTNSRDNATPSEHSSLSQPIGYDVGSGLVAPAYVPPPPTCRSAYFQALLTPGYLTGTDCALPQAPSRDDPPAGSEGEPAAAVAAPSPEELALIAADKAMALAPSPVIEVAPEQIGLTGLDSFFWLAEPPGPISATAGVSGLNVTAEARPVQYVWDFGDGQKEVTTDPGRPWTKGSKGTISHLYEATGRYDLGVEVIWKARWRTDDGPWQDLGVFSNSAGETYPVKEVVSVLVSTESLARPK